MSIFIKYKPTLDQILELRTLVDLLMWECRRMGWAYKLVGRNSDNTTKYYILRRKRNRIFTRLSTHPMSLRNDSVDMSVVVGCGEKGPYDVGMKDLFDKIRVQM